MDNKYWTVEFSGDGRTWLPVMKHDGTYRFDNEGDTISFYELKKYEYNCGLRVMERTESRLVWRPDIRTSPDDKLVNFQT